MIADNQHTRSLLPFWLESLSFYHQKDPKTLSNANFSDNDLIKIDHKNENGVQTLFNIPEMSQIGWSKLRIKGIILGNVLI